MPYVIDLNEDIFGAGIADAGVKAVAFSPNGEYLATASLNAARIWHWRRQDLIHDACDRLTGQLSPEEWRIYLGNEKYQPTCQNLTTW